MWIQWHVQECRLILALIFCFSFFFFGTTCLPVLKKPYRHTGLAHMQTFSISEQTCMRNTGVDCQLLFLVEDKKWMNFLNSLSFVIHIQPVLPISLLKKKVGLRIGLDAELHEIYEIERVYLSTIDSCSARVRGKSVSEQSFPHCAICRSQGSHTLCNVQRPTFVVLSKFCLVCGCVLL